MEKYFRFCFLGFFIAIGIILGSLKPFIDVDLLSNATVLGISLVVFIPFVILIIIMPLLYQKPFLFAIFKLILALWFSIAGFYFIFELSNNNFVEWIGTPVIEQMGYFITYAYYPYIIFIGALFSLILIMILPLDLEKIFYSTSNAKINAIKSFKSINKNKEANNPTIFTKVLIIIGIIWIELYAFLRFSIFYAILIQLFAGILYLIYSAWILLNIIYAKKDLRKIQQLPHMDAKDKKSESNSLNQSNGNNINYPNNNNTIIENENKTKNKTIQLNSSPEIFPKQNLKWFFLRGIINVFKSIFSLMILFGYGLISIIILSSIIVVPNFMPMWLDYMPILALCGLANGIIYKTIKSRYIMTFIPLVCLLIGAILFLLDPYNILEYRDVYLWLIGISITSIFSIYFLYVDDSNNHYEYSKRENNNSAIVRGYFSISFWKIIGFFMAFGSLFVSLLLKWGLYDESGFQIGLYALIFIAFILITSKIISKNKYWKSFKQKLDSLDMINEDNQNEENPTETPSKQNYLKNRELKKKSKNRSRNRSRNHSSNYFAIPINTKILIIAAIIVTSIIPMGFGIYRYEKATSEQILGTYNGDYYLWFVDSLRSVDPYYSPNFKLSNINPKVRISLARGEHEGFQVVFTPGRIKNLNVWNFWPIDDLKMINPNTTEEEQSIIGKGNISIFNVEYVEQLSEQYPDRLIPFKRLDTSLSLSSKNNFPFYVDVYIPRNDSILPGLYSTTLNFSCYDYHRPLPGEESKYKNRMVSFTLEVEIYNFTIPLERHIATEIIWHIKEREDWLDFYNEHRLDAYWPRSPVVSYNPKPGELSIEFNFTRWLNDLDYGFNHGMRYFPITWHPTGINWSESALNYTNEYKILLEWYIGNITNQIATKTTPWGTDYLEHAYFFIRDEPSPIYYPLLINISYIIHNISNQVRIMETLNQPLETYPDEFLSEIDIYCMYIHKWMPSKHFPKDNEINGWPQRLDEFVKSHTFPRKKEIWVYHTHNRFPTPDTDIYMAGILQRNSFWLHWIYNIPGWLYWSFNWGTDMNGGYGYAGFGESTLIGFGENEEPLGSLRLERIRDGIEDYEYFWILNNTLSKIPQNEQQNGIDLLNEVKNIFNQPQYLSHIPGSDTNLFEGFKWSYSPYSSDYLNLRNEIGKEITRIHALGII
ncbi:MAG: DUF4091 domain-containing protein [Promethearchaeota archaeon]